MIRCGNCELPRGTPQEARQRLRMLPAIVMAVQEGGGAALAPLARCWASDDQTCAAWKADEEQEARHAGGAVHT